MKEIETDWISSDGNFQLADNESNSSGESVVIRNILGDNYTLGDKLRRNDTRFENYHDYIQTRFTGYETYKFILGHTELVLDESTSILEIGCGDGRVAAEFARNHPSLSYTGFDINKNWIKQLKEKFQLPNYKFKYSDIHNGMYNPEGCQKPEKFSFKLADNDYDLIYLASVFTHMRLDGVRNYLSEIENLLDEGGEIWSSWYIIPEGSDEHKNGRNRVENFKYDMGNFYTCNKECPETAIAYSEEMINKLLSKTRLEIKNKTFGYWRNNNHKSDLHRLNQDILVLKK